MASSFPKIPGYIPTYPIDVRINTPNKKKNMKKKKKEKSFKRKSAAKQEYNRDILPKNLPPQNYPLPRNIPQQVPDQKGMFHPDYMSTTHDVYRPKNVPEDIVDLYQPSYVKMDRQTLRFNAFFKEICVETNLEQYRIRKVIVFYYLDDDSIQVNEPKQMNSGIPQGAFLKRQKILKSDGSGLHLNLYDLRIGQDIEFFGKNFHFYDCDQYTREFYENLGIPQGPSQDYESDNWEKKTLTQYVPIKDQMMKDFMEHKLGGGRVPPAKQFLENDRKVLKYYVFSDIPYIMHYFLADDTIEIREINYQNSGRDPFPLMLRRQKLPKKFALNQPGQTYAEDYTKPIDIVYGQIVDVFGRKFQINGCDPYTQLYYKEKLNIDFPLGHGYEQHYKDMPQREIPPYNGFGDEEDSLGYVYRLIPKPPKKDFFKWVDNQINLRFVGKFNTTKPEDIDRRFIITFYLNDESLQIYEPSVRNSGIPVGKFLERKKYKNVQNNNEFFLPTDLIVGKDIIINGFSFRILECDDFTKKWYQQHIKE
ncbi:hypothetical protein IMG5_100900 [Ichthyophthirius multifiliis]|uniref:DM10 domain-containing protein n=1 Tax=Ichthyophthirius multifiliis TaxID=5932 RepID=G0QSF8_ICHMU|nr:hypothetical protein IMG5_100900 [Ichthyophthirius multifiliis]EGR31837.1 hypothetical protein IMG5_100900 [Ichthyophthirius multifiliis]|eukprot:XP_004035323.1 hypothetical protein IMG5_100900 [Ichthyophthirius multifiliis]